MCPAPRPRSGTSASRHARTCGTTPIRGRRRRGRHVHPPRVPSAASPLGGAGAAAAAFSPPPSPSAASLSPPSPSPRVRARRRVFRLGAPALRLPRSLPRSRPLRRVITVLTFLLTVPCITDRKCHDVTGLRMGRDPHAPFASLRSSALPRCPHVPRTRTHRHHHLKHELRESTSHLPFFSHIEPTFSRSLDTTHSPTRGKNQAC